MIIIIRLCAIIVTIIGNQTRSAVEFFRVYQFSVQSAKIKLNDDLFQESVRTGQLYSGSRDLLSFVKPISARMRFTLRFNYRKYTSNDDDCAKPRTVLSVQVFRYKTTVGSGDNNGGLYRAK